MKYIVLMLFFITDFSFPSFASFFTQRQIRKDIRKGNKVYKQKKYINAEIEYRKALKDNVYSIDATYNLGNALYKQRKEQKALEQYQIVVNSEINKKKLSMAWHNIGNIFMETKDYKKSIDAYKNALRNNSKDNETRYNLALVQKLLQKNQTQQKSKQGQQNQKKQQEQQKNSNKISKENAIQILNALIQDEKNIQEKVREEKIKQQKNKITDKNW